MLGEAGCGRRSENPAPPEKAEKLMRITIGTDISTIGSCAALKSARRIQICWQKQERQTLPLSNWLNHRIIES